MPLQATSGAASYDAFGGGVPVVPNYIEDVFSTYLYTGNGSTQTITNGIDLSTEGGLVWVKSRTNAFVDHALSDTANGTGKYLSSNTTAAQTTTGNNLTAFNADGFTVGSRTEFNQTSASIASWTFRKQPKFFDVQTFTYPSSGSITVPHNLASTPGCVMVKMTNGVDNWYVYHRMANNGTNPSNYILQLNTTSAQINNFASWITVGSSSITFPSGALNPGSNFVIYLFAHDAGGFGLNGTDNVISCGSYTGNGAASNPITLGYEPQWVLLKRTDITGDWGILDTMRGWSYGDEGVLKPNTSGATDNGNTEGNPTATGFDIGNGNYNINTRSYIYIAIRRGPMKVPTSGTSVFYPLARTGNNTQTNLTGFGFPPDLAWTNRRDGAEGFTSDKLRGPTKYLTSQTTAAEGTYSSGLITLNQDGVTIGTSNEWNAGTPIANWFFRRAPSFFDEVCYTGNGTTLTVSHNLGVAPQLMIVKARSIASQNWFTYSETLGNNYALRLDQNYGIDVLGTFPYWNNTTPTSTNFVVSNSGNPQVTNGSGVTYVAYLFATCAKVSKVGSYTGTGTTLQIDCGFTGGARFVLIKRTDSTGGWHVWDSARGIVSGNDPYLLLNSTAAEVTNTDYIDTYSAGFEISSSAPSEINASGGTFIFLAIA